MIDLHCHVLPGIDDGPADWEESLALVRASHDLGVRRMVATSHVSPQYPNNSRTIAALVEELEQRLGDAGIDGVEVLAGAELAITQLDELPAGELELLSLGDSGWLLVESPFTLAIDVMLPICERLLRDGHRVLLAHPERCPGFHRRPELLGQLAGLGVRTSVTAGALSGTFGREVQRFARRMGDEGLLDSVASDAHERGRRGPGLEAPLEQAGFAAYTELLCDIVPAALLAGEDPPRPGPLTAAAAGQARRWWRLRSA